jgi:hypothetical protein
MLKQDSWEAEVISEALWVLSVSWCRCQSWFSPLSASLLHSLRRQWSWCCPLMGSFWIFLSGDWGWCHFMDCIFVCCSKWGTQVLSTVRIWDKKVSLSASKCATNSEEMAFLSFVFNCEALRNQTCAHLWISRILNDATFPLLLEDWVPVVRLWWADPCKWWH